MLETTGGDVLRPDSTSVHKVGTPNTRHGCLLLQKTRRNGAVNNASAKHVGVTSANLGACTLCFFFSLIPPFPS